MLIVISPAKSFSKEVKAPDLSYTQPGKLESSEKLIGKLRGLSKKKFAGLMNLSNDLAVMNMERHQSWKPPFGIDNADPAIFAFNGEVSGSPVPEPSTILLFGSGLAGLLGWQYRKKMNTVIG